MCMCSALLWTNYDILLVPSLIELNNIFTMCLFLHLYDSYDFTFKNIIL